jgi:hypothetical protein
MTAPPYPGPTKTLSNNYTVDGTQFAIADEDSDALEPEDIWRQGRAVEDHTHDDERGLPVRRLDAVSAPAAPGHVQVSGDDFKWWGATTGQVITSVTSGTDQTVDGTKRFADPILLPRQVTSPPAPGSGLGYLYLGPNDRLYLRSGTNPPAPVGTPGLLVPALAWQTQQVTGQPSVAQITLGGDPVWSLVYNQAQNQQATLMTVVPYNYGGTPIVCYVHWTYPNLAGMVNWTLLAQVTPAGGVFSTAAWASVAVLTDTAVAAPSPVHLRSLLQWTTGLPQPGDMVKFALKRDHTTEAAAGTSFPGDAYMLDAGLVFG